MLFGESMSIHDKTHSIWKELVRMREVMALDSYARQLRECDNALPSLDKIEAKDHIKHAEYVFGLAKEMDKVRTEMKRRAFPMEHL